MGNGWIKLHRKILDHWVSSEPELFAVWIRLLTEANHADVKKLFNGVMVEIKRGQLVFGLNAFSAKSGVSVAKLRRYISMLEKDSMINKQSASKYSIITITCFDNYQGIDKQTTSEAQADDKQAASKQQHYKNVKNANNEKNDKKQDKKTVAPLDYSSWPYVPNDECLTAWLASKKKAGGSISQRSINTVGKQMYDVVNAEMSIEDALDLAESGKWKGFQSSWVIKEKGRSVASRQPETIDQFRENAAAQAHRVHESGFLDDME